MKNAKCELETQLEGKYGLELSNKKKTFLEFGETIKLKAENKVKEEKFRLKKSSNIYLDFEKRYKSKTQSEAKENQNQKKEKNTSESEKKNNSTTKEKVNLKIEEIIYSKKEDLVGTEEKMSPKPREKTQSESQRKRPSNIIQKISSITVTKIINQKPRKETIQQLPKTIRIKLKELQQEEQKRLFSLFLFIFSSLFIIPTLILSLGAEKRRE